MWLCLTKEDRDGTGGMGGHDMNFRKFVQICMIVFTLISITACSNNDGELELNYNVPMGQKYIFYNSFTYGNELLVPLPANSNTIIDFITEWLSSIEIDSDEFGHLIKRDHINNIKVDSGIVYIDFNIKLYDFVDNSANPHLIIYIMDDIVKNFTQFDEVKGVAPSVEGKRKIEIGSEVLAEIYGTNEEERFINLRNPLGVSDGNFVRVYSILKDADTKVLVPFTVQIAAEDSDDLLLKTIRLQLNKDAIIPGTASLYGKVFGEKEPTVELNDNKLKIVLPEISAGELADKKDDLDFLIESLAMTINQFNLDKYEIFVGEDKVNISVQ